MPQEHEPRQLPGKPRESVGVPWFTLEEPKSVNGVPAIHVKFPDGHQDTLKLERFHSSEEERRAKKLDCNFIGHLENDSQACVAVTGCLGKEDLHFTINSKHSGPSNMYILKMNGQLEVVESNFKVEF